MIMFITDIGIEDGKIIVGTSIAGEIITVIITHIHTGIIDITIIIRIMVMLFASL